MGEASFKTKRRQGGRMKTDTELMSMWSEYFDDYKNAYIQRTEGKKFTEIEKMFGWKTGHDRLKYKKGVTILENYRKMHSDDVIVRAERALELISFSRDTPEFVKQTIKDLMTVVKESRL